MKNYQFIITVETPLTKDQKRRLYDRLKEVTGDWLELVSQDVKFSIRRGENIIGPVGK